MIKLSTLLAIPLTLSLIGCTSTPGQNYPTISEAETDAFLSSIQKRHKEGADKIQAMRATDVTTWFQPANVTEPCKVGMDGISEESDTAGMIFFWDGQCKDGYAKGLGRAFVESDQGLTAWLEEYPGGANAATIHYSANYDNNTTSVGNALYGGEMGAEVFETPNGVVLRTGYGVFDTQDWFGYIYESFSNKDVVRWRQVSTDGTSFTVLQSTDPSTPVNFYAAFMDAENNAIGFSLTSYRNGAVEHVAWEGGQKRLVRLPKSFTDHMASLAHKTQTELAKIHQKIGESQVALNIYKRRICKGDLKVEFMDSELYGQICLEYGDLSKYSDQLAAVESSVEQRQIANNERAAQQQKVAAERATTIAAQNAANANQTAAQIQSFSNSMNASAQSMAAFTNTMIRSTQNNAPSFNTPTQNKVQNCFNMGGIIHCR